MQDTYITNSHVNENNIRLLLSNPTAVQELFIHGIIEFFADNLVDFIVTHSHNISALLVTNGMMIGHNPTAKHIALAFQLEPSITVWKLPNCQITADVFYQLTSWLTTFPNNWTELDFEGCNITDTECEVIHQYVNCNKCQACVKTLNISFNKLTASLHAISKLAKVIVYWKVQKCLINGTDSNFHNTLISEIVNFLTLLVCKDKINLTVIADNHRSCFFYDICLNDMTFDDQVSEVFFISCHIKTCSQLSLILNKNCDPLRIFLFNNNISKALIVELLKEFQNSILELLIYDESVVMASICNSISSMNLQYHMNTSFVLMTDSILYGFNVTQYQLNYIQQVKK